MTARTPLFLVAACISLASCTGGGSNTPPSPPHMAGPVNYAALGDGRAAGTSASVPCPPAPAPALPSPPNCPGGTGYVPDIAKGLATQAAVTLTNLGIENAVIGPDVRANLNALGLGLPPVDLLSTEVPALPANSTLVTLFQGVLETTQLTNLASGSTIDTEVAKFEADYLKIIAQVRAKAPATRIVVANIPNVRLFKEFKSVALQNTYGRVSIALDTFINNIAATQNVTVVDLLCDAAIYQYGDLAGQLNDSAHAEIARAFLAGITTPAPPAAACAPYSLAAVPAPTSGSNPFLGIYVGKYALTGPGGSSGKMGFTINGDGTIAGGGQTSDGAGFRVNGAIDSNGMMKLSATNGTDNFGNFSGPASLNAQNHLIGTLTSGNGTLTFDLTRS